LTAAGGPLTAGFYGHPRDTRVYSAHSSFSTPPSVFSLDLGTGKTALWHSPHLEGFVPSEFETHQVFYPSNVFDDFIGAAEHLSKSQWTNPARLALSGRSNGGLLVGAVDNPAEFDALYAYSPYHNVKSGVNYPATLIMTSDHDDRVFPAHSFKLPQPCSTRIPKGIPSCCASKRGRGTARGFPPQSSSSKWSTSTPSSCTPSAWPRLPVELRQNTGRVTP
jgi:prolyl oligopeptidase PreP (S9A serine peptidase family)